MSGVIAGAREAKEGAPGMQKTCVLNARISKIFTVPHALFLSSQHLYTFRTRAFLFFVFFKTHMPPIICLKELVSRAQERTGAKLSLCLEYG